MNPSDASRQSAVLQKAYTQLLDKFQPDPSSPRPVPVQKAIYIARSLQQRALRLQTPQERKQQTELDRMIQTPHDRATLTQLTDQAFRSRVPYRVADQLIHILDVQGIPRFFSPIDRTLLKGFQSFGSYLPGVAVPLVKEKMHQETANVILPAEREMLTRHLRQRREAGLRMNVNFLGEALLGEEEAQQRLQRYLQALQVPEIEVISVKISTIYSQISPLAREHTINTLCERMELLYRAAAKQRYTRADGSSVPKFVYLDMEEFRDMAITAEVFMRTLDRKGLEQVNAGMALQAYIPDSFHMQQRINSWARGRVAAGGAPVTLRVVKGANMEMERVEASIRGWPQATYQAKWETDANFKRMLHEAVKPENLEAVRVGVASHNLFDLAYGLVLASEGQNLDKIQFEMLEGMANHQRRALFELTHNLLLYAPACKHEDFVHAIAYLIRRLDENTGPENFLRHAFKLDVDSDEWRRLEQGFVQSFDRLEQVAAEARRTQNRRSPPEPVVCERPWQKFVNEADTDFALTDNCRWAEETVQQWTDRCDDNAQEVPLVINGQTVWETDAVGQCMDPSRPGVVVGRYRQAHQGELEKAIACARADDDGWRALPPQERAQQLAPVAQEIRAARGELMGAALADGGKILTESDPEVSEAVDFVEFYRKTALDFQQTPGLQARGKGVVVVVSPWNFPIAIPCGGISAALAAGNTVILKPASDTVLVAYHLCQCFWRAGVSKKVLQLAPCTGATGGQQLVAHPDVDVVILTGGTATALSMLRQHPQMNLLAETGGKNATIVTALSDRDQAIKHVLHSAFSHSGQKCSATSLLILEQEVYEDPQFKRTLCDAVESLQVGSAWQLHTKVGPLIRPPAGDLENALKELEPGESWAVMPRRAEDNPQLYSPGVKWGVQPGSYTHMTEFFGPVLGVMPARNLEHAIEMVNQTGYGLTSGLESLDDREQQLWSKSIRAGNLYINRPTTGAIVLRQPFGGMGKSAFGPGIKAGGPNYVAQLMSYDESHAPHALEAVSDPTLREFQNQLSRLRQQDLDELPPDELERVVAAISSYDQNVRQEFGKSHDHFLLVGEDNYRRYLPVRELRVRVHPNDSLFDIYARVAAAKAVDCRITVSFPLDGRTAHLQHLDALTQGWAGAIEFVEESDQDLVSIVQEHETDRIRFAEPGRVPEALRQAVAATGLYVADAPVRMQGRLELLWYVREQSLSIDYHRYGNLGERSSEQRSETL